MGRRNLGLSLKRNNHMKYKNAALAVLFTASLAVAVQDFGVPPGIPNVFSAGEVAVADDMNANFEWVENELGGLALVDDSQDVRIDDVESDSKQRVQSLAALGYIYSGGGAGPLPEEGAVRGGFPSDYWGWLNIPFPLDWDPSTEITVTVGLMNLVNPSGQTGQDIEVDLYGDLIAPGDPTFDDYNGPFCAPGPVCGFDFSANCFISVPTVNSGGGGPLLNDQTLGFETPHLVTATFTIAASRLMIGAQNATQMRINLFEPSNPLVVSEQKGEPDPIIVLQGPADYNPFQPPSFVTIEYTAL